MLWTVSRVRQIVVAAAALFGVTTLWCWLRKPMVVILQDQPHAQSAPVQPLDPHRLVAIGDLHGDLDQALAALQLAALIDNSSVWTGGTATLVQTGDLLDRGPDSLGLVALFEQLKEGAATAGGQVVTLLGNHEGLNLLGSYGYVAREELQRLGGGDEVLGQARWQGHMQRGDAIGGALHSRLPAAVLGSGRCRTLFVHGGLTEAVLQQASVAAGAAGALPSKPEKLLQGLQKLLTAAVEQCVGTEPPLCDEGSIELRTLAGRDSILWLRDYVQQQEAQFCPGLHRVLRAFGVARMVVGHNVMRKGRIRSKCDGALHLIDLGMSRAYFGPHHLGVWSCEHGQPRALYRDAMFTLPRSARHKDIPAL